MWHPFSSQFSGHKSGNYSNFNKFPKGSSLTPTGAFRTIFLSRLGFPRSLAPPPLHITHHKFRTSPAQFRKSTLIFQQARNSAIAHSSFYTRGVNPSQFGAFYRKFRGYQYVPEQDWVHGERASASLWGEHRISPDRLPLAYREQPYHLTWRTLFTFPLTIFRFLRRLRKWWRRTRSRGRKMLRKRKHKMWYRRKAGYLPWFMRMGSKKRRRRIFLKPWRVLWSKFNTVFPAYWRPMTRIMIGPIILWFWIAFGALFFPYPAIDNRSDTGILASDYVKSITEERDHLGHLTDLEFRFVETSHTWDIRRWLMTMVTSFYDFMIRYFGWMVGYGNITNKDMPSAPEKLLDLIANERVDVWNVVGGPFIPFWEHPVLFDWEGRIQLHLTRQLKSMLNFYESDVEVDQTPQLHIYDDIHNVEYGIFTLPFAGSKSFGLLFGVTVREIGRPNVPERFLSLKLLLPEYGTVIKLEIPSLYSSNPRFDLISEELQKKHIPKDSKKKEHQVVNFPRAHPHERANLELKLI